MTTPKGAPLDDERQALEAYPCAADLEPAEQRERFPAPPRMGFRLRRGTPPPPVAVATLEADAPSRKRTRKA